MLKIDTDEVINLSCEVRRDTLQLMAAVKDRAFFDIGCEIGIAARGGLGYDHLLQDLERFEGCIRAHCEWSFDDTYGRIYDLVNFYDHIIQMILTHQEHLRKGEEMTKNLIKWRNNAGRLAQVISQMCEGD
jgi:hypothetical protein